MTIGFLFKLRWMNGTACSQLMFLLPRSLISMCLRKSRKPPAEFNNIWNASASIADSDRLYYRSRPQTVARALVYQANFWMNSSIFYTPRECSSFLLVWSLSPEPRVEGRTDHDVNIESEEKYWWVTVALFCHKEMIWHRDKGPGMKKFIWISLCAVKDRNCCMLQIRPFEANSLPCSQASMQCHINVVSAVSYEYCLYCRFIIFSKLVLKTYHKLCWILWVIKVFTSSPQLPGNYSAAEILARSLVNIVNSIQLALHWKVTSWVAANNENLIMQA